MNEKSFEDFGSFEFIKKEENFERRFLPATELAAKERLRNFRDGIKDFQEKYPEVLGATVFGSMIKGELAHSESDIDAFLYVDAEKIPFNSDTNTLKDAREVAREYRTKFLKEQLHVSDVDEKEYYHDFIPQLLSEDFLDKEINTFVDKYVKYAAHKKMINDSYGDPLVTSEDRTKLRQEEPNLPDFTRELIGIFHARVGSGIEKYRRLFLEKITALPKEVAEQTWSSVYPGLVVMEERNDRNKRIKIPRTLEDALQTYHPELYVKVTASKDELPV